MKLIKLQNKFILVSDEEINYDDEPWLLIFGKFETYIHNHKGDNVPTDKHFKIIAGIPKLPSIDFSLLSEEDCKTIGWVDVEKLFIEKSNIPYFPSDLKKTCNWWFNEGFKTAQSLNDKVFSLEDMKDALFTALNTEKETCCIAHTNDSIVRNIIQSLQQTSWNVEVEMEIKLGYGEGTGEIRPKITNNSIKILRIL